MIYLWYTYDTFPDSAICIYEYEKIADLFVFEHGISLGKMDRPIEFTANTSVKKIIKFDEVVNNSPAPLVSNRLSELLLKLLPGDIQLFDTVIKGADGVITDYKLVNVIRQFTGLNHDASEYSFRYGTKKILDFTRLVYNKECLGKLKIARDSEYLSSVLVAEDIYQALMSEKFRGLSFLSEDEFVNGF